MLRNNFVHLKQGVHDIPLNEHLPNTGAIPKSIMFQLVHKCKSGFKATNMLSDVIKVEAGPQM